MRTQYVIKVLWMASLPTCRGGLYSPFVPCDDRAPHRVQNAPRSTCRRPSAASPGPLEGPAEAPALRAGSEGARLPRRCIRGWGEGLHLVLSAGAATRRVHKVNSRVSITSFHHGLWKVRCLQPGTCLFPKAFYLPTVLDCRRPQAIATAGKRRRGDVGNTVRWGPAQGVLGEGVRPAQDKLGCRLSPGAQVRALT